MSNELPNFENKRHLCDNNKKSKAHKTPFRPFQRPCRRIIKVEPVVVVVVSDKALRLRTAETTIFIHSMSNELPNFENKRHLCDNNKKSKAHKTPFRP